MTTGSDTRAMQQITFRKAAMRMVVTVVSSVQGPALRRSERVV